MSGDPVDLFKDLERPVTPRPEFVVALEQDLLAELGDSPVSQAAAPAGPARFDPSPTTRRGWIAAIAAAAAVLLVVGGVPWALRTIGAEDAFGPTPLITRARPTPGLPTEIPIEGHSYVLYLPRDYEFAQPLPLVVSLTTPSDGPTGGLGPWDLGLVDEEAFALVSLQPSQKSWAFLGSKSEAVDWPATGQFVPSHGTGDVDLVRAVLEDAAQRLPVADGKVLVFGRNESTPMVFRLACELPGLIDGVSAGTGDVYSPAECQTSNSVSIVAVGPPVLFPDQDNLALLERWAAQFDCVASATELDATTGGSLVSWGSCGTGGTIRYYDTAPTDSPTSLVWRAFQEIWER